MALFRRKRTPQITRAIAELLEPRVMYSADALGPLAALLPDDNEELETDFLLPEAWQPEAVESTRQIAFVMSDLPDVEQIASGLDRAGIDIVWINSSDNGMQLITDELSKLSELDAIHIVSHGEPSSLQLGAFSLDSQTIDLVESQLKSWSVALDTDADILIYGCDFASEENGAALLSRIAGLSNADVAASNDLTGHASLGADWNLEVVEGDIEADTFDDDELRLEWRETLPVATIVVSNQTDSVDPDLGATAATLGPDPTLREAIIAAMNTAGDVTIELSSAGTYSLTRNGGDQTGRNGDIDITMVAATDELIINNTSGSAVTIDQTRTTRIFELYQGVLQFNDVTITGNGYDANGSGFYTHEDTTLVINRSTVENLNSFTNLGGAFYIEGSLELVDSVVSGNHGNGGGAIYGTDTSSVNLTRTDLISNTSDNTGGAITTEGDITQEGGVVRNNYSMQFGGAYISSGDVVINSVEFRENSTEFSGGALNQVGGSLSVTNSTFVENVAISAQGGAIQVGSGATLNVENVAFRSNTAIGNDGSGASAAGDGGAGAVAVDVPNAVFRNVFFEQNEGFIGGGVVLFENADNVIFEQTSFTQNKSERFHQSGNAAGGGVAVFSDGVVFNGVLFDKNESRDGGGVYLDDVSSNTVFTNVTFSENTASREAGAIYSRSEYSIEHGTFYKNIAGTKGGALRAHEDVYVGSSVFFENEADSSFEDFETSKSIVSQGFNFFTDAEMSQLDETATDQYNMSAAERASIGLDVLTPNAGTISSHPLLPNSALINAGSSAEAGNPDSRGVVRDSVPDVGAHESVAAEPMYYMIDDQDRVLRGDFYSGFMQVIVDGRPADGSIFSRDIVVDISGGKIYWIEQSGGDSSIMMSDTDGGNVQVFAPFSGETARALAFDNVSNRLYVAYTGSAKPIHWFDVLAGAGSAATRLGTLETNEARDIEVDPITGMVVWTQGPAFNPQEVVTASSGGTPGTSVSTGGLLNGVAINPYTQTITTLSVFANEALSYDYSLNSIPGSATVAGESLDYNPVAENYLSSSIGNRTMTLSDSNLVEIASITLSGIRPEGVALVMPDNPPELVAANQVSVNENGVRDIDNTLLRVENTNGPDLPSDIVFSVQYFSENPIDPPDPQAGIYLQDAISFVYTRLEQGDTFTQQDVDDGLVQYQQHGQEDHPTSSSDRIDLAVRGLTGTYPGTITLAVDVVGVNDTPIVDSALDWSVSENGAVLLSSALLSVSDNDIADDPSSINYVVDSLPPSATGETDPSKLAGLYLEDELSGTISRVAIGGSFTQQDIDDGRVEYRQNGQERNTVATDNQVQLTASDPAGSSTGAITIDVVVTAVDDSPAVVNSLDWALAENDTLPISSTLLLIEDADLADDPSDIVITLNGLPPGVVGETDPDKLAGLYLEDALSGTFTRLSVGDTFTQQDIDDGLVEYRQNGQEINAVATDDRVQLTASDPAGNSTGAFTIDVVVTAVDDSPVVVNSLDWALAENDTLPITSTLLLIEDADLADDPSDIVFTLNGLPPGVVGETDPDKLAGLYLEDALSGTFTRMSVGDTFTQQDIDDGLVEYRQNGQERNTAATDDRVQLTATDPAGNSTGAFTVDVVVTDVNDTPELVNALDWSVSEDAILLIDQSLLLVSDNDIADVPADITFTLNSLPVSPTSETDPDLIAGLYLRDEITGIYNRLDLGDNFTQQDINDGRLEYRQNGQEGHVLANDDRVQLSASDPAGALISPIDINVVVEDVQDDPVIVNSLDWDLAEDGTLSIREDRLLVTDSDLADNAAAIVFTLDAVPTSPTGATAVNEIAGLYKLDSVSGSFSRLNIADTFTQQDVRDGLIEYRQNGQERNTLPDDDRVLLSVEDSTGRTPGPIAINVGITDVPDVPIVQQSGPWTVGENAELQLSGSLLPPTNNGVLLVTDNDLADTPDSLRYTVVSIPTPASPTPSPSQPAGLFRLDITSLALDPYTALSVGDTFTQHDIDDGLIIYRQNGQERLSSSVPDRLELTVVDQAGNTTASPLIIEITVIPENDSPVISLGSASVAEGEVIQLDSSVISVSDADGTPIESMTFELINPVHGTIEVDGGANRPVSGAEMISGLVTYTHNNLETGDGLVLVRVTDPSGGTDEEQLSILVNLTNDQPIVDSNPLTVDEMSFAEILPSNLTATDEETENSSLRYVLDMTSLSHGVIEDTSGVLRTEFTQQELASRQILYVHDGSEPAPESVRFSVHDANGGITPASLDILVQPTNDTPVLVGTIDDQIAQEGQLFSLTLDQGLWSDSDTGDVLDLNVVQTGALALPGWLSFDSNTGELSGIPQNGDVGNHSISVTASDQAGAASVPLVFEIDVRNTNTAPDELSLVGQNVSENIAGALVGIVSARDIDVGDELTYSVSDSRFDIVSGELVLKPEVALDHEEEASIDLTISATDNAGEIATMGVTIVVDDINDVPVLQTTPSIPVLQQNVPLQIPVDTFSDQDQFDTITYSATLEDGSALPDWIEFTDQREFILLSSVPAISSINVVLIADDSNGGRAELPLSLSFEPVAAAAEPEPVLIEVPDFEPDAVIPPAVVSQEPEMAEAEPEPEPESTTQTTKGPAAESEATDVDQIQQVDLQALIAPLPSASDFEQVEVLESEFRVLSSKLATTQNVDSINVAELSDLLGTDPQSFSREYKDLVEALDNQRDEFSEEISFRQKMVGTTVSLTSGFSVGYVVWLIRGGTLMGSMLSALPAWRFVDPLPILGALEDGDLGDDDSLEAMVNSENSDTSRQLEQENPRDDDDQASQSKAA